ncbi:MAG: hypothetical protein JRG73_21105 [Deltaproteobacteria bacterium]|nr:hypothetical protein [Deltaproteobacteria bacterium]
MAEEVYEGEVVETESKALTKVESTPAPVSAEQLIQEVEAHAQQAQRMRQIAAKITLDSDWIEMGDRVYLQGVGAERALATLGLTRRIVEGPVREERKDEKGAYYIYRYRVTLESRDGQVLIEQEGMCSSRDKFFATYTEWVDDPDRPGKRKKITHERHQCQLGLRGMTKADLKKLGREVITSVAYDGKPVEKSPPRHSTTPSTPPPTNPGSPGGGGPEGPGEPQPNPQEEKSWPEVIREWCAEARRVLEEYGVEADKKYLAYDDGKKFVPFDDVRTKWPKYESAKRRRWLAGTLKKMREEYPPKSDEEVEKAKPGEMTDAIGFRAAG